MMQNLKIQNSKETKNILEILHQQYGLDTDDIRQEFVFLINKDNRIYIVSKDVANIDFDVLLIDTFGMYFGELYRDTVRLSIEGAQIVGRKALKNIVFLDYDTMIDWIKGYDVEFEDCGKDFVIVKYQNKDSGKDDVLGCGKYKDGKLVNYVSKSRRLVVVNI